MAWQDPSGDLTNVNEAYRAECRENELLHAVFQRAQQHLSDALAGHARAAKPPKADAYHAAYYQGAAEALSAVIRDYDASLREAA